MTALQTSIAISIGVVVACEQSDSPWLDEIWRPIGILLGESDIKPWTVLRQGDGFVHYFAGCQTLELHRKETEAYQFNLANSDPSVYVVMRDNEDDDGGNPVDIHLVTVSAYEAQDYLDSGEELVEPIAMPETLVSWVRRFVDQHHVEEKFIKRRRDEVNLEDHKFGQEPVFLRPAAKLNGGAHD